MQLLTLCLSLIDNETEQHKFEKLYWKYKNLLYHCVRKRLNDEHLVEDAVSNTFLYVAQNMQMIDDVESGKTRNLLVIIAERAAINLYKKQQREYNRTVSVDEVTDMAQKSNMELAYQVKEAMKQLPEDYQQAMILRYAEGYTNREIAQEMQEFIEKVKRGEIKQKRVSLGWQYHTRNGLVAVLLCFIMTFLAVPEAVIAGYHKLVEVIEIVVTEYTEYHYNSQESSDSEFEQITFEYLPEGFTETDVFQKERLYSVVFRKNEQYFSLEQSILTEEDGLRYIVDTENAEVDQRYIGHEEVQLILKDESFNYIWLHEKYLITGQSNLSADEIMEILEQTTLKE